MKYNRHRRIWDRWELDYFNKVFYKMMGRKKKNGHPYYSSGKEVFYELNDIYREVYGKERFSSYESYMSWRNQKLRMK